MESIVFLSVLSIFERKATFSFSCLEKICGFVKFLKEFGRGKERGEDAPGGYFCEAAYVSICCVDSQYSALDIYVYLYICTQILSASLKKKFGNAYTCVYAHDYINAYAHVYTFVCLAAKAQDQATNVDEHKARL